MSDNWQNQTLLKRTSTVCALYELVHHPSEIFAFILLQEMACAHDGGMRLILGTRHDIEGVFIESRDGITVTERLQEGLVEATQHFPRGAVRRSRGIVGARGNQHWEDPCASLIGVIGKRRVIGGANFWREIAQTRGVQDLSSDKVRNLLGILSPCFKGRARGVIAGGQECIGDNYATESIRMLRHQSESDQAAPILSHKCNARKIETIEEQRPHPLHVTCIAIVRGVGGFIRSSETH